MVNRRYIYLVVDLRKTCEQTTEESRWTSSKSRLDEMAGEKVLRSYDGGTGKFQLTMLPGSEMLKWAKY